MISRIENCNLESAGDTTSNYMTPLVHLSRADSARQKVPAFYGTSIVIDKKRPAYLTGDNGQVAARKPRDAFIIVAYR